MGFFDFLNDAKDNYDRRKEAREYIQRAKELVQEGNEIYERAYSKVAGYAYETEYKLSQHVAYKRSIAEEFGVTYQNTLKSFDMFDIDSKVISTPSIGIEDFSNFMINDSNLGLSVFSTSLSNCIRSEIPFSDFFFSSDDYYAAKSQRDEARRFKESMKYEREKMYAYRDKMSEIRSFIDIEKNELETLTGKIRNLTNELEQSMHKKIFTTEEAQYLKGIRIILEKLMCLISTKFLCDSFDINQKYQQLFSEIKIMNQNLPEAPSIKDSGTLKAIIAIIDKR